MILQFLDIFYMSRLICNFLRAFIFPRLNKFQEKKILSECFYFPIMENIFSNSLINSENFRESNISDIMLSLKCDHPLLFEFSILFSAVKVKLVHKFSQIIHKFNIWILKCCSGAVHISKFFSIHKEMGNWNFWNTWIAFPNCPQFTKKLEWKLRFFSCCLHIWLNGEGGLSVSQHMASEEPIYD